MGVCTGVPLLLLLGLDRLDLALYATFGAFTTIYGSGLPASARRRIQLRQAAVLCAAVATGVVVALTPHASVIAVPVSAAWAVAAAWLSQRQGWRPAGPLFPVFAVAACSSVQLASAEAAVVAWLASVMTAALALTLTVLSARTSVTTRRPASPAPAASRTGGGAPGPERFDARRARALAAASGAAVAVAGVIATTSTPGHPYWAMVAAAVPMSATTLSGQVLRAAHRVVGTLVGIGLSALLLAVPQSPVATVLVVIGLQVVAELLVTRNYGAALVFITPLALLLGQLAHAQAVSTLLVDRVVETVLGCAVGVAVLVLSTRLARGRPQFAT